MLFRKMHPNNLTGIKEMAHKMGWLLVLLLVAGRGFSQQVVCEFAKISNIRMYNGTSDTLMLHISPKPVFAQFNIAPPYQMLLPGDTTFLASLEWAGTFKEPTSFFEFVWVGGYVDLDANEKANWIFSAQSDLAGEYLFTISRAVYADRPDFKHFKPVILPPSIPEDTTVYQVFLLEKEAGYPGGIPQLQNDLNKYLVNQLSTYEGRSYYEFVVEKNGSISQFKVLRGGDEVIQKRVESFV